MRSRPSSLQGYTLVELATVVLIVGLLLSAVLGFNRLKANAAIAATVRDVTAAGAATAVFVDRYGALPGDLRDAAMKVPGCTASSCEADGAAGTTGDGSIGVPGRITRHQTGGAQPAERETLLFWTHLALTDLISGVAEPHGATATPDPAWGATHPVAPVGGGFHVKDADGGASDSLPGWPPGADDPSGTFLVLQPGVAEDLVPAAKGRQVLTPGTASTIDRKMDDGDPFGGSVVGYGAPPSMAIDGCFSWTAVDRGTYAESNESRDCGLAFRIAP